MNIMQGPPPPGQNKVSTAVLEHAVRVGASWFYSIAGLSLINTIAALAGTSWRFVIGLCATDILSSMAADERFAAMKPFGIVVSLVILAVYAMFGLFSRRGQSWAFVVGFIFYTLDSVALLLLGLASGAMADVAINLIFHGWALFRIGVGMKASFDLGKVRAEAARVAYYARQQEQPSYYQPQGTDPTNPNLPR